MTKLPLNFTETANQRFNEAKQFLNNWRTEARDSFAFIAGKQWLEIDEAYLQEQKRPPITFNYSEKMIDAVIGAEVSNRQEVTYRPRDKTDAAKTELYNNAAKWVRDECNAEDEETDAFRDTLICGMGWTRTGLTYDEDLEGKIDTNRVDPLEMYYDPAATKPGLTDRRYHFHVWWVDKVEAQKEWPDAYSFAEEENSMSSGVIRQGHRYDSDQDDYDAQDMHKDQVQIRVYECIEREIVYRIDSGNGLTQMTASEFSAAKAALDASGIKYIKQYKKVYYKAYFAGETLLEGDKSPCQTGFLYNCITGKRDRNTNTWYGLTRVMKDPQRWANKWLSQILHIINSNAKGGLMAETGAFVDPVKAQDEWSSPESVTLLNEGGLQKVKEKTMTSFPAGLDRLMEFALSSLPMVTGINLEALGLANREQAGILEQQRKQAAYGLLAPIFDSLRRYRKAQGRVLLSLMHDFISDGRMVRIGGPDSQQFVPFLKEPGVLKYDIIIDQSPNAPDVKDKTWQTLQNLIPNMIKVGMPLPPNLLDYAPIPVALSLEWKKVLEQHQGGSPEQLKQQMQKMQQQLQQVQTQNQQLQQQLSSKQEDLALKREEMQLAHKLKVDQAQAEMQLKATELDAEINLKQQEQNAELALKGRAQVADEQLRAQEIKATQSDNTPKD